MRWDSSVARLALYTARGTFAAIKRTVPAERHTELLSAAIAQLLEAHPDLDAAEAARRAAKATGVPPSPDLFTADRAPTNGAADKERAAAPRPARKKAVRKKALPRKTSNKKVARKKAAKKKAVRTTVDRAKTGRKTTRRKKATSR